MFLSLIVNTDTSAIFSDAKVICGSSDRRRLHSHYENVFHNHMFFTILWDGNHLVHIPDNSLAICINQSVDCSYHKVSIYTVPTCNIFMVLLGRVILFWNFYQTQSLLTKSVLKNFSSFAFHSLLEATKALS